MSLRWTQADVDQYLRRGQPDPLPALTEAVWQAAVLRVLTEAGFMVYHTHDSRHSPSGWPDVAAIKPTGGTLYLCELKTDTGQLTLAQQAWLEALGQCSGVVAEVWKPQDVEAICQKLKA